MTEVITTGAPVDHDPDSATLAEICVVACARAWAGDGEILASPITLIPTIGARLARATTDPDLLLSDGVASLGAGTWPVGDAPAVVEGWLPYRTVFDLVASGRRHVMMGPVQLDRYGNANLSAIGDFDRPKRALLGMRGAPGNTVNHPTSYWVPRHGTRVFVEKVDVVCGIGYDTAKAAGPTALQFLDLRRVVTNLGVLDFGGPDHAMRLVFTHPGVTVEEVQEATGFPLALADEVATTPLPTPVELQLIREVIDPKALREREVKPR
ncbi:CoA-transferase subunit beta [Pseudonocardia sp. CA-107938]|uniref:CoA-transferase subunit beta n=1 Tax=Pseudonocardia sp. CA-107938 TaxID=3240021 RepID=UPI003D8E165E